MTAMYRLCGWREVNWIRNVRSAGRGRLSRGRKSETVRISELPPERRV